MTVVGVAFARPLLALTGAEGAMLDLRECYLRIIFLGSLFVNFAQSSNMIMRGEGELARAMGIMAGGAILNMVLAPVFILALRDQGLGLEGAACATVLSQAVLAGVMLWWFVKREKTARIVRVAASRAVLAEVAKVGVSAMLSRRCSRSSSVRRSSAARRPSGAARSGGSAVRRGAAHPVVRVHPAGALSNGFQPCAMNYYGAGLYDRVRRCTVAFSLGRRGLRCCSGYHAMLFPEAALSLFITDPALVAQGVDDFRVFFRRLSGDGVMVMRGLTLFQSLGKGVVWRRCSRARPLLLFGIAARAGVANLGSLGIPACGVWPARSPTACWR